MEQKIYKKLTELASYSLLIDFPDYSVFRKAISACRSAGESLKPNS